MATIESNFESICINPNDDLVLYEKEIVRSRIEKFLYAICSLDTDDLPTPLSRIEELYNCLVTGGDIPTFTPLSRAEKFVMAMLGAYDVELLPTPISRSETLMKKIATGDNNLDDVDNLQSRYEFLLAYIIKAGGFNGGSGDFYYNLTSLTSSFTTIYGTLDKPVKNAVLRGQTLKNLSPLTGVTTLKPGNVIFIENTGIKTNTTYTIMFNCSNVPSTNFVEIRTMIDNTQITQVQQNVSARYNKFAIKTHTSKETNRFRFKNDTTSTTDFIFSELVILEGDYTNENISYFEGMASVKMPVLTTAGKNLFNPSKLICNTGEYINVVKLEEGEYSIQTELTNQWESQNVYVSIKLKQGERIFWYGSVKNIANARIFKNDFNTLVAYHNYSQIPTNYESFELAYVASEDCTVFLRFWLNGVYSIGYIKNIMIEINNTKTEYEPHKSTTVSCNEEVELRSIGDIKDELNLVTGELTQRIQERVFDGSENWIIGGTGDNYIMFRCENYTDMVKSSNAITCDKYAYTKVNNATSNLSVTNSTTTGKICIITSQKDLSIDNFKAKLNTDKPTIQYQLAEPIVKTVDLSILGQDENVLLILENGEYINTENGDYIKVSTKSKETKLSTFDDVTHVTVSSEGLVPTGEITVATKNATDVIDASVMSLRMDDILNSQNTLEESANAQSDDIDVTMLGTTDIYEQLS